MLQGEPRLHACPALPVRLDHNRRRDVAGHHSVAHRKTGPRWRCIRKKLGDDHARASDPRLQVSVLARIRTTQASSDRGHGSATLGQSCHVSRGVDARSEAAHDSDALAREASSEGLSSSKALVAGLPSTDNGHPMRVAFLGRSSPHQERWPLVDGQQLPGIVGIKQGGEAHTFALPASDLVLEWQQRIGRWFAGSRAVIVQHGNPTWPQPGGPAGPRARPPRQQPPPLRGVRGLTCRRGRVSKPRPPEDRPPTRYGLAGVGP